MNFSHPKLEQNLWTHNLFQKSFLQKCFSENEKCSFYNFHANFLTKARKNFVNLHKIFLKESFFLKCSSGNKKFDFDNLAGKFLPERRKCFWTFFLNWKFRPKKILWKKRMQDCQACWNFFSRSAKKNYEPIVFLKQLCSP